MVPFSRLPLGRLIKTGCGIVLSVTLFVDVHGQESFALPTTSQKSDSSQISEQDQTPASLKEGVPPQMSKEMIEEINSIRQRMGGGVASRLSGLFPDKDSDTGTTKAGPVRPVPAGPQESQLLQHEFDQHLRSLSGIRSQAPRFSAQNVPSTSVVTCLRAAARHADLAAAELEDAAQYAFADQLRAQAQQMRLKAREASLRPQKIR